MLRVMIESPYAGDVPHNVRYAREALFDSIKRGEAPLASHLLYTQVLDDGQNLQRSLGLTLHFAWLPMVDLVAAYIDHGVSPGMAMAIQRAEAHNIPVVERTLG